MQVLPRLEKNAFRRIPYNHTQSHRGSKPTLNSSFCLRNWNWMGVTVYHFPQCHFLPEWHNQKDKDEDEIIACMRQSVGHCFRVEN
jgi:hypothetical protein